MHASRAKPHIAKPGNRFRVTLVRARAIGPSRNGRLSSSRAVRRLSLFDRDTGVCTIPFTPPEGGTPAGVAFVATPHAGRISPGSPVSPLNKSKQTRLARRAYVQEHPQIRQRITGDDNAAAVAARTSAYNTNFRQ